LNLSGVGNGIRSLGKTITTPCFCVQSYSLTPPTLLAKDTGDDEASAAADNEASAAASAKAASAVANAAQQKQIAFRRNRNWNTGHSNKTAITTSVTTYRTELQPESQLRATVSILDYCTKHCKFPSFRQQQSGY